MNKLKSTFSRLFKHISRFTPNGMTAEKMTFPTDLLAKDKIFQYLNFSIPELQPTRAALEFGNKEKAFEQFFQYLKTRHSPVPLCNWWKRKEIVQLLKEQYPESLLFLVEAADKIFQHQFLLFSAHEIQTGTPISWNRSYEKDAGFDTELWKPGKTYTTAMLMEEAHNDIHFVWALNRHQHFLDLGKAYWCTGDETYAEEFMRQINGWIAQNPYPQSVNWVHDYEIALRGLFWLFGYAFFLFSELITEHFFCRFYQMLLYHGHAVYTSLQTPSKKSLRTHHIVAQAAFLYLLGIMFPEYIHSKAWGTFGWDVLQWKSELLTLDSIFDDSLAGFTNSLELYCLVLMVRTNNRYHIPKRVAEGITTMFEHLVPFIKPNGNLCGFGETPPEKLLAGMYTRTNDFRYLFAIAALLLKNPTLKTFGKTFEDPLLWFFGKRGIQDFDRITVTPPAQSSCLVPHSPHAVMRSGWERDSGYCLISTGLGNLRLPHELKHADLLSFELCANGQDYLIDSGPYSLHPTDEWNQYFRSIQAHNGISVDRIKHFNFYNLQTESTFDRWISTPTFDFLSGYHTGFEDLEEPILHRRSIFYYKPTYWILCDLLTGEGQHFFDQYFHFPPVKLNVDFTNKRVDIQTKHHHHFTLMPINPHEMDVTIFTGGDSPDSGWISKGYKKKTEASFIKYGKQAIAPTSFHTLLLAYVDEDIINLSGQCLQAFSQNGEPLLSHEVSAVEISGQHETHYFALLYQDRQCIRVGKITFDGTLFFLRIQEDTVLEIILHNATLLTIDEKVLFQSETPVEHLTLQLEGDTLHVICTGNHTFRMQLPHIRQVFVNQRRAFLKHEHNMILVSTMRV